MQIGDPRRPRQSLIQARVVLHRAGAERVKAKVDGIVLLRETREVAHDLRLRKSGQANRPAAADPAQPLLDRGRLRQVDPGAPRFVLLEEQLLFYLQSAIAGERAGDRIERHHSTSPSAAVSRAMSSSRV